MLKSLKNRSFPIYEKKNIWVTQKPKEFLLLTTKHIDPLVLEEGFLLRKTIFPYYRFFFINYRSLIQTFVNGFHDPKAVLSAPVL